MCGRYDLVVTGGMLAARFGVFSDEAGEELQDWQPRYNIAPSQLNPVVVTADGQGKHLVRMKWGLVPGWSKEPKTSFSTINARAETVTQKPAFRKLLSSRRCLVPATGYFEWAPASAAEGKQPYRVQVTDDGDAREGEIVAMAGLYDVWRGQGLDGEALLTYTIITTEASPGLRRLHERMPVILSRENEEVWLDPGVKDAERLVGLLRPYPNEKIGAYRVGRDVNSPSNDRAQVIEAYGSSRSRFGKAGHTATPTT
jgi:putative SOS response-associated peptidase YedK